jgi:hypothetical protein
MHYHTILQSDNTHHANNHSNTTAITIQGINKVFTSSTHACNLLTTIVVVVVPVILRVERLSAISENAQYFFQVCYNVSIQAFHARHVIFKFVPGSYQTLTQNCDPREKFPLLQTQF